MTRIAGLFISGLLLVCGLAAAQARAELPLAPEDLRWLNRVTYGIDSATVAAYRTLGRAAFLSQQLNPTGLTDPPELTQALAALGTQDKPLAQTLVEVEADLRRIRALPAAEQQPARKARIEAGNEQALIAAQRHVLRALYSPAQLREQMVGFWLNHFSVFYGKGNLRWMVGDYEARAIAPHALGKFRDLVRATLTHPAMLQYLDNAQSSVGKINENYARELLELHTLGIDGGYTQRDVQELARVLTGVGVSAGAAPLRLPPKWRASALREGAFEFNPARHDFGNKRVLGQTIEGQGFGEVERVIDLVSRHPSTARFISAKLARAFVSDEPPAALVAQMAQSFTRSDGDITAVLRTMFESDAFVQSLQGETATGKFRDPLQYIVACLRFTQDGRVLANLRPLVNGLVPLGQSLYGRVTPDGYGLAEKDWASPGQLARRVDTARALAGSSTQGRNAPLYRVAVEPLLSDTTRAELARAHSPQEWTLLVLASPEWMYR